MRGSDGGYEGERERESVCVCVCDGGMSVREMEA